MNKMQLLILNVLLLTTAGLATFGLVASHGQPPSIPLYEPRMVESSGQPTVAVQEAGPVSSLDVQVIWEKNLMHPSRSSAVDEVVATAVAVDNRPADLELVGIGKVGSREAAVILVHAPALRRTPRGLRPPGQSEPPAISKRRIYNVGDVIEDTGYRLQEIHFDKQAGLREVVLVDENGASRTLKIETNDSASLSRAATAAESTAAIERAAAAAVAVPQPAAVAPALAATRGGGDGGSPPPPPPAPAGVAGQPPPTPATIGAPAGEAGVPDKPVAEMSREERLRWAIEMRRRQMQTNPGSPTGQPGQPGQPNRP